MISKARNIILICLTGIILLSTILSLGTSLLGLASIPKKSYLEGRSYQGKPDVSLQAIANSTFQDDIEQFFADHIVMRDKVVLSNALAQRLFITIANTPFGYEAYPTFYDSSYIYIPEFDMVCETPSIVNPELEKSLSRGIEKWNELIEAYPDINWYMYMPDRGNVTTVLPSHNYVAKPADYTYWQEHFLSKLSPQIVIEYGASDSIDSFRRNYFNTDHHWQIDGALNAYQKLATPMGYEAKALPPTYNVNMDYFYGSSARNGLCEVDTADKVRDVFLNLEKYLVTIDGELVEITSLDKGAISRDAEYRTIDRFENLYASWFHTDYGLIHIENTEVEKGTLLIIGDSFSNNIERLYAAHYHSVYVLDPRHYKDSTVSEFISSEQPDDVLVLLSTTNIAWDELLERL